VATEDGFGETATVGVWIDAGSVYENIYNNGTAHFLEHMAFKGTTNRTKHDIEVAVETKGAHLNAYTSREQTVYVGQCFSKDTSFMLGLIADILQNSELNKHCLEAERDVILKEKEVVELSEDELLFDYLHAIVYQGHPLGLTILGEVENIQSITRNHLVDFIDTHYTAPRFVVVGSGSVKHNELVTIADGLFKNLPSVNRAISPPPPKWVGSEIRLPDENRPTAHIIYSWEGVSWADPFYYTILVIQTLIGHWDRNFGGGKHLSSRLADTVASNGLAYSFQTLSTCYKHTGFIGIYAIAPPENLEQLTYEVFQEFKLLGHKITEEELERAKNKVKTSFLLVLDGSMNIAEDIGRQYLTLGRRLTPTEFFARIDSITIEDVLTCLERSFNDTCPGIVALGPIQNLPSYNTMREWTN
jgi:processing peptidase subunit beta